jgi:hypothetical protein
MQLGLSAPRAIYEIEQVVECGNACSGLRWVLALYCCMYRIHSLRDVLVDEHTGERERKGRFEIWTLVRTEIWDTCTLQEAVHLQSC